MTKLSIITINLNNVIGLRKTIDSVVNQTFTDLEHIIIDGGSIDGSVEIIKDYEASNDLANRLFWVSEIDKGIYNAMNKGIKQASGEYCLFLNSGDELIAPDSISKSIIQSENNDLIINDLVYTKDDIKIVQHLPHSISMRFLSYSNIPHCSTFIKSDLFERFGYYDESFKIVSDHLFFLQLFLIHRVSFIITHIPLTLFDTNGISSSENFKKIGYEERLNAQNLVLPNYVWQFADEFMFLEGRYNGLMSSTTVKIALIFSKIFNFFKLH